MSQINARVRHKRDTSSNWTTSNPVLLDGELIIVDTDSGEVRFKIGDGVKTYTQLPFQDEVVREIISNHTTDISGLETSVSNKVDKEDVKAITDDQIDAICGQSIIAASEVEY